MGWANERDRDTCIRIEIRKETDYEKTDWEPQGFSRHQNQFQHLLDGRTPQAGGTFERRRRDRARREIHRRNQRHGAFLHRNLLSRKKGAPLEKAVLLLIT